MFHPTGLYFPPVTINRDRQVAPIISGAPRRRENYIISKK
jgi:hypothetical protein